jgi:peptidylprolyl isomerase
MRTLPVLILFSSLVLGFIACGDDRDDEPTTKAGSGSASNAARRLVEQVAPPVDLKAPPGDATKTASGLVYKKLAANDGGALVTGHDTVLVQYTGWRPRTGETFFTTKGGGQPIAIDLAHAAPAFTEALQLLHKGERAALWVAAQDGMTEAVVYEVEVVDVVAPPAVAKRTSRDAKDDGPKPRAQSR